ncbi:MAG: protein kinase [Deltaproteobacteria bacterium]|nr:protein kinase [Deltaproteobacteria bacterium]MDQ3299547.1 protein kinase [Myxococcota bacterium]
MQASIDKGGQSGPFGRQDPSLPQVFGRYLLIQRLSRGGMGEIFLAKHGLAGFEKLAVIKKVLPHLAADEQFISRFVDEAQVAIKLQHVNVAQVFEVGRCGEEYFLALEYVEGRDLRRTLGMLGHRKQRLPVDLALFIGRELANGLAYAHRRTTSDGSSLNLVHCDISPPNVLVSFEGETKVIDFGIAKSAMRGTATDPKMGFGKFGYMAPEQLIRGGQVDHRTDIYAAGVVLFEVLTGVRLYEAGPEPDYRALAKKVAKGDHQLPSEVDPALAPYDDLVATALCPKPEDRYQSAAEFRDSIQQALVAVNPTISTDQLGSFMRDLFAEEMTAQKELHERVAKTHIADFQEQFHTQTISTVSFAVAQLPLAPADTPRGPRRSAQHAAIAGARPSGSHPVGKPSGSHPLPPVVAPVVAKTTGSESAVRPSPALDTMAPPTSAMVPHADLSLADGTGTSVREQPPGTRKLPWVIALLGVAAIGAAIFALTRGPDKAGAVAAADKAPRKHEITVVPIEPTEPVTTPVTAPGSAAEPASSGSSEPAAGSADVPIKIQPHVRPHRPRPPKPDVPPRDPPKKPELGVSRDVVTNEWMATRRDYAAYKSKNGSQLEKEYTDLVVYVQYNMSSEANLAATLGKIQSFRRKIRE